MSKNKNILTLKNDLVFKAVYGSDNEESKFILKNLLNKILDRTDNPIVDLTYKNPFNLREYKGDKESVLDIKVEADLEYPDLEAFDDDYKIDDEEDYKRKKLIDVEMQIIWHKNMKPRILTYLGGLMRESLHSSDDYDKMRQTIVICITDDIVFEDTDKFLTRFYFTDESGKIIFSKRVCIICVELPKVNPDNRPLDELSPLEICLEYLKHADENGSEYVQALIRSGGEELEMTEAKLKRTTEEDRLREKALAREWFLRDEADRRARDAKMDRRERYLDDREKALDQRDQALDQRNHALDQREYELEQRRLKIASSLKKIGQLDEEFIKSLNLTENEIKNL